MVYQRDPLSVRYDPQARLVLALAIDQHRKRVQNLKLVPYVRVRVDNPLTLAGPRDEGGLSKAERAFQRALYHDPRIHKPRRTSRGEWSLKVEWDEAPLLPAAHRNVKVTVFRPEEAARFAAKKPKREQWQHNATLQSGGVGSPKQRFA
jgi:hypothetical protein